MTTHIATADLNETTFAYQEAGTGAPVVLIHAGIADSRMWGEASHGLFQELAESFKVVRYDLRGFGLTPPGEGGYSHHEDLLALLIHLGIGRAALVGCSMGSKTALDFALQYPDRVERLVLTSPAISGFRYGGRPPRQAAELEAAEAAGDLSRVNELEMQVWVDGPHRAPDEVAPRVRELALEMNADALANEGVGDERPLEPPATGRLADVAAPTLVLAGELDADMTLAAVEMLMANLPSVRQVVIPGAAHLPNMEQPKMYNRLVIDFLSD